MLRQIRSAHNPRYKSARQLRSRRGRRSAGRFLIDGVREVERACDADFELLEFYVRSEQREEVSALGGRLSAGGVAGFELPADLFRRLAYGDRDDGIVAVARTPSRPLAALALPPEACIAVLESIEKPGNLGAVLRSADAAGVHGVVLCGPTGDPENPNCIRASLGTVFHVPLAIADPEEVRDWLADGGFAVFAAQPGAAPRYCDIRYPARTALVLGSEARGLSPVWREEGVTGIHVPMQGRADSLNVSVTAAVLFYEVWRQRQAHGG